MRYVKLYEEFVMSPSKNKKIDKELSDKTIEDVLKDDFFDDVDNYTETPKEKDTDIVAKIKNWETY